MITKKDLKRIKNYVWEIPKSFRKDMRVPARLYASSKILESVFEDKSLTQLINTATLPGIVDYALAMPDIHEGYGFPIGGVVATRLPEGVISPGGVGYDINCGTRLLLSQIKFGEIRPHLDTLLDVLFQEIPSGLGIEGKIKLSSKDLDEVLKHGARWAVEAGFGTEEDLEKCEEGGAIKEADPTKVSERAKKRGGGALGTLGSGNHFLEVQRIEEIFNQEIAKNWGLFLGQITFQIHSGSRGLGHQVCSDYINLLRQSIAKYQINISDPELICTPFNSSEGESYFQAMSAAANFAWANRQCLSHLIREAVKKALGGKFNRELKILYDVAHNIAKVEEYTLKSGQEVRVKGPQKPKIETQNSKLVKVCVHRKGATRAFPGQPVLIPGSMGTASYILVGTGKAMEETFGSTCHGAGRVMSRRRAKRQIWGEELQKELLKRGIITKTKSISGLAEEAPQAYKDIEEVVRVVDAVGIATKVAKLKPLGVIKG